MSAPAWQAPAELVTLQSAATGYVLPADATPRQRADGWDCLAQLDAEAGAWLRLHVWEGRDFYLKAAKSTAAAADALSQALQAASPLASAEVAR